MSCEVVVVVGSVGVLVCIYGGTVVVSILIGVKSDTKDTRRRYSSVVGGARSFWGICTTRKCQYLVHAGTAGTTW